VAVQHTERSLLLEQHAVRLDPVPRGQVCRQHRRSAASSRSIVRWAVLLQPTHQHPALHSRGSLDLREQVQRRTRQHSVVDRMRSCWSSALSLHPLPGLPRRYPPPHARPHALALQSRYLAVMDNWGEHRTIAGFLHHFLRKVLHSSSVCSVVVCI
jgi:hypothetical protein